MKTYRETAIFIIPLTVLGGSKDKYLNLAILFLTQVMQTYETFRLRPGSNIRGVRELGRGQK